MICERLATVVSRRSVPRRSWCGAVSRYSRKGHPAPDVSVGGAVTLTANKTERPVVIRRSQR